MSTQVNTNLLERAADCVDHFDGKMPAKLIEKDLETNDLESLLVHVTQAEQMIMEQESNDCN